VDTSALAAVAFKEPEGEAITAQLSGHQLHAPLLFTYEMANVCWVKIRRSPAARATIFEQFIDAQRVPIGLNDVDFSGVVELALRHNLTVYDASYLWLADNLGAELVTLDEKLEQAAKTI
jgi:predicted nucleic acid-binding protein